jgi:hypothetical protein
MTPAETIRESIMEALRRQDANVALAGEYARLCTNLNRRLQQIEEVLDRGDDIQALQMAEIHPTVMDEADVLSFFKSLEWGRLCERHQIAVAPEIRSHVIDKLNAVYEKGISSTHPIYRQLRDAILARDDNQALKIARTIESLSPGDSGAKTERKRLERKVFSNLVSELGKALSAGDNSRIISLLDEAEQMVPAGEQDVSAEILTARKIRDERDARDARERVCGILAELDVKSGLQDWRETMEQTALVQVLCDRHAIQLDPVQQGILGNAREFSEKKRADAVKKAAFDEALRSFLICLDDASSRTQASGTLGIDEAGDLLMRLNKEWQVMESFGLPVDPARVEETSRIVEILRNELSRLQKRRVASIAALAAILLSALIATGWFVSVQYRAREMSRGLVSGRLARSMASVKRILTDAEQTTLSKFNTQLSSEIASSRKWLEALEKESAGCTDELANFLKRGVDFTKEDPVKLEAEYQRLLSRIKELPDEQQKLMQPDLLKLDKAYSDHLANLGSKDDKDLEELLAKFEKLAKALEGNGLQLEEIKKNLAARKELENSWSAIVRSPIKDLPVSAALKAKAEVDEEATKNLGAAVASVDAALSALDKATTTEQYRAALGLLKDVPLPCCRLISDAKIAWNLDCTPDGLLAELLFPGNPGAYESLKQGKSDDDQARRLFPKSISGSEVDSFAAILNDELTRDVKVYNLEGGDPSRSVYSRLEIKASVEDGDLSVFTVKIYDPSKDSETKPEFTPKTYRASGKGWEKAKKFTGGSDAEASKIYRNLGLNGVVSDSLEVHVSVIRLLELLTQSQAKDPVYQAYVIQQLLQMTSKRPYAWGLQYSPAAANLMKDVDQTIRMTCGSLPQGAWMSRSYQKMIPKLKPFLEKPRQFLAEAQLIKLLAEQAIDNGAFLYAGYVGEDGKPHLIADLTSPPSDLYGMSGAKDARKAARVFRLQEGAEPSAYATLTNPIPLTQLYYLKKGRKGMLEAGLQSLRIESISNELALPPLFDDIGASPSKTQQP